MSTQTLPDLAVGQKYLLSCGEAIIKEINNLVVEVEIENEYVRSYGRSEFEILIAHGDITLVDSYC